MTENELAEKNAQFAKGVMELAFRMGYVTRDDELVRCKDCKHLRIVNRQELAAMCSFHCYKFEPFADDYRECFCSWAERKEE